jgi:hypothetical protein
VTLLNYKRDLLVAVVGGILIEFILWLPFYLAVTAGPTAISQFAWLDWLQEPGRAVGIFVWRSLYGLVESYTVRVWIGSICGISVLIAAWSVGVFVFLKTIRLVRTQVKYPPPKIQT